MTFLAHELDILIHWMEERRRIQQRRAAGLAKPWTHDRLLRDYRWCNVRRMDDRVSCQLFELWYDIPSRDVRTEFTAATLARLINWVPTLLQLTAGKPFGLAHMDDARRLLRNYAGVADKVFTGAYIVPGVPGKSKTDSVMDTAYEVSARAEDLYADSMRGTWLNLCGSCGVPYLGNFLAGQIVADLAHLYTGHEWHDRDTWAPIGPGSARGLNRLLGRDKDRPVSQLQFEDTLPKLIETVALFVDIKAWNLQAMDIQNCLCEFDKYMRLQLGEGTVRSTYPGAASTTGNLLT